MHKYSNSIMRVYYKLSLPLINPRRACAARVTASVCLCSSVCLSVCLLSGFLHPHARQNGFSSYTGLILDLVIL